MGRKTILNEQMIKQAGAMVAEGMTDRAVQDMIGISHDTWYKWMNRGEDEEETEPLYSEFAETIKKAKSRLQYDCIHAIKEASRREWQAAAWLLERKWSEDFGKKDRIDMNLSAVQIIDNIPATGVPFETD